MKLTDYIKGKNRKIPNSRFIPLYSESESNTRVLVPHNILLLHVLVNIKEEIIKLEQTMNSLR